MKRTYESVIADRALTVATCLVALGMLLSSAPAEAQRVANRNICASDAPGSTLFEATVTVRGNATQFPTPNLTDSVQLLGIHFEAVFNPSTLLRGYELGFLRNGSNLVVPRVNDRALAVEATNTDEPIWMNQTPINLPSETVTIFDPDNDPTTPNQSVASGPLVVEFPVNELSEWTPSGGDIQFFQGPLTVTVQLQSPVYGPVDVELGPCEVDPEPAESFASLLDGDADRWMDIRDNCDSAPNTTQQNSDTDSLGDACDNCPTISNLDQTNHDTDDLGDACDPDDDNDTIPDVDDNCQYIGNPSQLDNDILEGDDGGDACDPDDDNDTIADVGDNCPFEANQDQLNNDILDGDDLGDVCDDDDDNDYVPDVGTPPELDDNCHPDDPTRVELS